MGIEGSGAPGGFAPCFPVRDLRVEDADEFGRRLEETAAPGTSEPYDTAYGREVVHVDPDHNLLRFVAQARSRAGKVDR
jgi:hypothetical protein